MAALEIYVLNVGQADTTIISTPGGNIIVIDAYRVDKVRGLLRKISPKGKISHLIVTHPHDDHFGAASRVLQDEDSSVQEVVLAPFWVRKKGRQKKYREIIGQAQEQQIALRFLCGYERAYPDGGTYPEYRDVVWLELVGPPNDILARLQKGRKFNENHLSIIARLNYGEFSMVFAADAQMENWQQYDEEGMLERRCHVLKAAHHGSAKGTQYERLEQLSPKLTIVSSDPAGRDELPDYVGSTTFEDYHSRTNRQVVLTADTGSIKIVVGDPSRGKYDAFCYDENPEDEVRPGSERSLPLNPTDWCSLVDKRKELKRDERRVETVVEDEEESGREGNG